MVHLQEYLLHFLQLSQNSQKVTFFYDKIIFSVKLQFRTGIFSVQNFVARFYGGWLVFFTWAYGNYSSFLRFFFGGIRNNDSGCRCGFRFIWLYQNSVC